MDKTPFAGMSRRRLICTTAAAGLTSVAARQSRAQLGDRLSLRAERDIETLDPAYFTGSIEELILSCTLVTLNRYVGNGTTAWEPYAAKSLTVTDNGRAILFELHDGIVWSGDYGPLTAEDVKFSFERLIDPEAASPWAGDFAQLDHVEVTGLRSGILHLKNPFAPLLTSVLPWYTGHIVCKQAVEEFGDRFTVELPAVCGPYRIIEWEPKQRILLERNPDWTLFDPVYEEAELLIVEDEKLAELAYDAGEVDFTTIDPYSLERYTGSRSPETMVRHQEGLNYVWLGMNVENPALQDINRRRAIQYAIDVDDILMAVYGNAAKRATGFIPTTMIGHRERNTIPKPDLERARNLLSEAGVSDGFSLTLSCLNTTRFQTMAQVIQSQLSMVGIEVEVIAYDPGVFWNLGLESEGDDWKELQLVLQRWGMGTDPYEPTQWQTCDQVGVWNWQRFCSEEIDQLHHRAMIEADGEKRDDMYRRIQDIWEESGAYVFITNEPDVVVYRDSIDPSLRPDLTPHLPFFKHA